MNPKIKNLVEELQLECDKSDIALVLGMIAPNMEDGMISFNGTFGECKIFCVNEKIHTKKEVASVE
ncbi:hypothetical protein [Enterococcus faecium]|uniref:hypothetical protein n=1 Tax=Enterococcus faecium TaxID=1352 RepID=UPI0028929263|nr:hypothetical protein [Enterococcus faecium]MDT2372338.1 hypothetical protein [Enterococcus faecium]MDW3692864.1 hypothetical protein [Enterococcus faecium]